MAIYVLAKLVVYTAWVYAGMHWLDRAHAGFLEGIRLALLRLLLGIAFGGLVFVGVGGISDEDVLSKYLLIYTPIRIIEWGIIAFIIVRSGDTPFRRSRVLSRPVLLWCLGGVVVSFVADLASPEGLAGHFCVGRCLC